MLTRECAQAVFGLPPTPQLCDLRQARCVSEPWLLPLWSKGLMEAVAQGLGWAPGLGTPVVRARPGPVCPCDFGCCFPTGARVEEFLYEKLDRKVPSRVTNGELLAQYMAEAASELGPTTPYGEQPPRARILGFPTLISPLYFPSLPSFLPFKKLHS